MKEFPIIRDFEKHSLFGMSREASAIYAKEHGHELEILIGYGYSVVRTCYDSGAHNAFATPKTWQISVPVRVVRGPANCPCHQFDNDYPNSTPPRRI